MCFKDKLLLTCGLFTLFSGAHAHAGFEWTPPEKKVLPPVTDFQPMPPVTQDPVQSEPVAPPPAPVVEEAVQVEMPAADEEDAPAQAEDVVHSAPVEPEPAPPIVEDVLKEEPEVIQEEENSVIEVVDHIDELDEDDAPPAPTVVPEPAPEAKDVTVPAPAEEEIPEEQAIPAVDENADADAAPLIPPPAPTEDIYWNVAPEAGEPSDPQPLEINAFPIEQKDTPEAAVVSPPQEEKGEDLASLEIDFFPDISAVEDKTDEHNISPAIEEKAAPDTQEETFSVIQGFGTDMPLALALRQIAPPRYAYAFGKGVDPGVQVSWQGGEPWNVVLGKALEPLGVTYNLESRTLISLQIPSFQKDNEDELVVTKAIAPKEQVIEQVVDPLDAAQPEPIVELDVLEEPKEEEEQKPSPLDEIYGDAPEDSKKKTARPAAFEHDQAEIIDVHNINPSAGEETVALTELSQAHADQDSIVWHDTTPPPRAAEEHTQKAEDIIEIVEHDALPEEAPALEIVPPSENIEPDVPSENEQHVSEEPVNLVPTQDTAELVQDQDVQISTAPTLDEPTHSFRTQPSDKIRIWQAKKGARLKKILEKWAETENIQMVWTGSEDYRVNKDVFISSTFENAVDVLITKSIKNAPAYRMHDAPDYALYIESE